MMKTMIFFLKESCPATLVSAAQTTLPPPPPFDAESN